MYVHNLSESIYRFSHGSGFSLSLSLRNWKCNTVRPLPVPSEKT